VLQQELPAPLFGGVLRSQSRGSNWRRPGPTFQCPYFSLTPPVAPAGRIRHQPTATIDMIPEGGATATLRPPGWQVIPIQSPYGLLSPSASKGPARGTPAAFNPGV